MTVLNDDNIIAGDSTSASYTPDREPLTGWGQVIDRYFQPESTVRNEAVSGSSSMSFREAASGGGTFPRAV